MCTTVITDYDRRSVQVSKRVIGRHAFVISAPQLWNRLPVDVAAYVVPLRNNIRLNEI